MRNNRYIYILFFAANCILFSCAQGSMEAEKAMVMSKDSVAYTEGDQEQIELNFSSDTLSEEQKDLFGKRAIQKLEDYYDCLEIISNPKYDSTLRVEAKNIAAELFYDTSHAQRRLNTSYINPSSGKVMALNIFVFSAPKSVNDSIYKDKIRHEVGFDSQHNLYVSFTIRKVKKNFGNEQQVVWETYLEDWRAAEEKYK